MIISSLPTLLMFCVLRGLHPIWGLTAFHNIVYYTVYDIIRNGSHFVLLQHKLHVGIRGMEFYYRRTVDRLTAVTE